MPRAHAIGGALALLAIVVLAIVIYVTLSHPKPTVLTVAMVDYRFQPDHLTFHHDVRYQLHLENHGLDTHEFTAPVFFASADIENPEVLTRERSEVVVQPGEAKDIILIARKPGTYDLRCSDHDWNGMVGGITVD